MALQRDYILPNTSLIVSGAYHIITDISVDKRNNNVPEPVKPTDDIVQPEPIYENLPDGRQMTDEEKLSSLPTNLNPTGSFNNSQSEDLQVYWQNGYTSRIAVSVFASEEARNAGKNPIAVLGYHTNRIEPNVQLGTKGMDAKIIFKVNSESEDGILTQAYNYLKTTDYYSSSIDI